MAIQEMMNCVESEDVFFDSVDHLSAEGSAVDGVLGCELWRDGLRSVKERRDAFLHEMGFVEPSHSVESGDGGSLEMGLERMVERSGTVSSSCSSSCTDCAEEYNVEFCGRECDGNSSLVVDEWERDEPIRQSMDVYTDDDARPSSSKDHREDCRIVKLKSVNKKIGHWWKDLMSKKREVIDRCTCEAEKGETKKFEISRRKVNLNNKKFKELSALFTVQEIRAHKGIIWTMKFSPDGQYLASGGQDGVVRVWRVKSMDSCLERFSDESSLRRDKKSGFGRKKKVKVPVVLPDKMLQIEEQPVQEFYGHAGDVLDLAWSNANCLLSSSTDKTVRLWQVESDKCLKIFHHTDYVTCVQFNPVNEHCFISGSIDGKVRIWGVSKGRVIDWADAGDAVTALCYQPDGQGFVVGSLRGTCRFYETKDDSVELTAHILIHSSRKSSTNRITGIKFSPEESQTVMVMSEDSKLRIFDKMEVICKYRGLPKSGSQMSASFTSNGRHIISIGDDSRVYIWNHEHQSILSSKPEKSIRSCEHFHAEGVSVALPWSDTKTAAKVPSSWNPEHEADSRIQDPPSFSFSNLFSFRSSATWPEDMLPIFDPQDQGQGAEQAVFPSTWGLVIVTADCDGMIRTFHNYGIPVRV